MRSVRESFDKSKERVTSQSWLFITQKQIIRLLDTNWGRENLGVGLTHTQSA